MKNFTFILAALILSGCSSVSVETPDGLKITSTSVFTNRGIEEAKYGDAYIKGYNAASSTDAIKAAAEGAAAGALK
jgi:hypothetical protein